VGGGQVDAITIVLPKKALEALERRSASEGKAVEELINEAVFKQLGIADPGSRLNFT
jgi:hypothetical protein